METFDDYGISIPYGKTTGRIKTVCPQCRDKRSHPNDRSLSVDLDKKVWNCHYCHWSGCLHDNTPARPRKEYFRPQPRRLNAVPPKVSAYMVQRGISEKTILAAKVDTAREFIPHAGKEMNVICFNYFRDGVLVNTKFRTGDKHFKLISGAELPPYNMDSIVGKKECIITEGEMDCLSFIEAGCDNVVSVPNGASSLGFVDEYFELFEDKERIFLATDNDRAGIEMRDELIRRLGAERCCLVTFGEGCKDANDHLVKYGKESLCECLLNARDVKVSGVFDESDYDGELTDAYWHGFQKGFTTGHENLDPLLSFETKRLCVVTGIPTCGKSEFVDDMMVRINIRYGYKVGYFSPENLPFQYHAVKLLEKLTGDKFSQGTMAYQTFEKAKEYIRENFFHIMPEEGSTLSNILDKARYLVRRKGIRILVLDPYNRIENEQPGGMTETQYISWQLDRITEFAQRNDVLVILVAHPTKITRDNSDGGVPSLYNISGSAHFYNKADFGLVIHRYDDHTLVRVQKVKFRHMGNKGDAEFSFNTRNGRYAPWQPGMTPIQDNRSYLLTKISDNPNISCDDPIGQQPDEPLPF